MTPGDSTVPLLPSSPRVHPHALAVRSAYHADTVARVAQAVHSHPVVVVGMAWNVPVKKARAFLDAKGVKYEYLEIGNYLTQWRERLAVKIWSGWPTFPQVFVNGQLVGGYSDLVALDRDGDLARLLP